MSDNCLIHHGIKGQQWGVRRFQNEDGSLTNAGKRRYDDPPTLVDRLKRGVSSAKTAVKREAGAVKREVRAVNSAVQEKRAKTPKINIEKEYTGKSAKDKINRKAYESAKDVSTGKLVGKTIAKTTVPAVLAIASATSLANASRMLKYNGNDGYAAITGVLAAVSGVTLGSIAVRNAAVGGTAVVQKARGRYD